MRKGKKRNVHSERIKINQDRQKKQDHCDVNAARTGLMINIMFFSSPKPEVVLEFN